MQAGISPPPKSNANALSIRALRAALPRGGSGRAANLELRFTRLKPGAPTAGRLSVNEELQKRTGEDAGATPAKATADRSRQITALRMTTDLQLEFVLVPLASRARIQGEVPPLGLTPSVGMTRHEEELASWCAGGRSSAALREEFFWSAGERGCTRGRRSRVSDMPANG